jgi:uncharacterized membrane protein YbhN (UPF0104 family)
MTDKIDVSVVLPAYNEANRIEDTVKVVKDTLEKLDYGYEIIIAEDGSTDGTDEIAKRLSSRDPRIVHLHSDNRLGRGKALTNAMEIAKGDVVVYLDVDLSTDMDHLKELIDAVAKEGYDIATGSRLLKDSQTERPFKRDFASKVYNFLVRLMLGSKLRDHQCGFKAFKRSSVLKLLRDVKDNHWFWDTEVLVLAQRKGLRVKEIPVKWKQSGETKVKFTKDVLYMFSQILRMWMESKRSKRFMTVSILISATLLIALAYFSGFNLSSLMKIDVKTILIAIVVYALTFFVRGYRFEYIISKLGFKTSVAFSTESVAISQMVNVITPARLGDFVRAYVFKMRDVPISTCVSALAVERFFDLFAVIILSFVSIALLGSFKFLKTTIYASLILLFLIALVFLLSRMENVIGKMSKEVNRVLRGGFVSLMALSIFNWTLDVLTCYVISLTFGVNVWVIALSVAISNIVKAIPVTPGGIGAYEVVMTGIITAFGLNPSDAFTIALIDHTLKNVLTITIGYLAIAHLNVKVRDLT